MTKHKRFKSGYAARKSRELATFYKPLADGFKQTRPNTADTFMPAQMVKCR